MRYICLIVFITFTTAANATGDLRKNFHGTWGTMKECARAPIKSGGTVLLEPTKIGPRWLKQGKVWCSLDWGPVETRKDGFFTAARAQCGEDSVRSYFLGMKLTGNNLRLRWGFPGLSDLLARCPAS